MQSIRRPDILPWQWWQKVLFRFFFIFLGLQIFISLTYLIPGSDVVMQYFYDATDWVLMLANDHLFHFKNSGIYTDDIGNGWYSQANQWTLALLSLIGCIIWSVADRKRKNYVILNYWLCIFTRYYIAVNGFSYGLDKIQLLQMPFPNQSMLSTPLGDLSPMRLSWMFVGYSAPYQFFSGLMECIAGTLLLFRRTTTLGAMIAAGVFTNVLLLNLSYDIGVTYLAFNLLLGSVYLLANEWNRIVCFFFLKKPADTGSLYNFPYESKAMRSAQRVLKVVFISGIFFSYFYTLNSFYKTDVGITKPVRKGIYDVAVYAVNKDTLPQLTTDTLRWQNMIFEANGVGSINVADTSLRPRYHRGYFVFSTDTIKHTLTLKKFAGDSLPAMTFRYAVPDTTSIDLWGKRNNDSLYVKLVKSNRQFQLEARKIHWYWEGRLWR